MDTLQSMRLFTKVVQEGSFTNAAQHAELTTAYVSRAVSSLEAHLRTRLLHRTTRRISLTPAGERFFARCCRILPEIDVAEAEARDTSHEVSGTLRIHAPSGIGAHYLVPSIARYRKLYPDVEVELTLSHHAPDILREGFDLAVVLSTGLPDSGMVSHRLGSTYSIACASPEYLRDRPPVVTPTDLEQHECLTLVIPTLGPETWSADGPTGTEVVGVNGSFRVNTAESMIAALEAGMGIGLLPLYTALEPLRSGRLRRVLPAHRFRKMSVYQTYLSRQFVDATVRSWVQHVRDELEGAFERDELVLEGLTQVADTQ
ncbi:LysR family transcriptional regulator [Pararobbsia alpina]|uniref:LysR family transcriptional regulator n=1 Tax=Pararobbsia alpina TaxID=621374 RepID=UPI0039A5460C